jgi:hypothetical protein
MATFTEEQIDLCTITRCESFKTNGVHDYWVIEVRDDNGCTYEYRDEITSGDADNETIKAAIRAVMLTKECKAPAPIKTTDSNDDLVGTKLS